jgi:bifunctional non-homologous end joining protein LigD
MKRTNDATEVTLEGHTLHLTNQDQPDMLVFDLDPGPNVSFEMVCEATLDIRTILTHAALAVWAKTSGGKGLHLVLPLAPGHSFDGVRE